MRLLFLATALLGLLITCSKQPEQTSRVLSIESFYVRKDTSSLRHELCDKTNAIRTQIIGSLHQYLLAKAQGRASQSDSLHLMLTWITPFCIDEMGLQDLPSKFSLYRSKDQEWCSQKIELDADYAGLVTQTEALRAVRNPSQEQKDSLVCNLIQVCNRAAQLGDIERLGLGFALLGTVRAEHFMDYATAERLCEFAIQNLSQILDWEPVSNAYINRGYTLLQLGQVSQAIACFSEADSLCRILGLRVGAATCNYFLAESFFSEGSLDSALAAAQRSAELRKEMNDTASLAYSLSCEGLVQEKRGLLDEADQLYNQADKLFRASNDTSGLSMNMLRRSSLLLQVGSITPAESLVDSVLIRDRDPELRLFASYVSALCNYKLGLVDRARGLLEKCLAEIEKSRGYAEASPMLVGFLSDKIDMYDLLTQIHIDRYTRSASKEDLDSVLCAMERGRAQSLREMMEQPPLQTADRSPESLSLSLSGCTLSLDTGVPSDSTGHEPLIDKSLNSRMPTRDVSLPFARKSKEPRLNEIAVSHCRKDILNDEEVILEYCTGNFGCYLMMISKSDVLLERLPVTIDSLDRLIRTALAQLRTRPSDVSALDEFMPLSKTLFDLLIPKKLQSSLVGRTLMVIPSGRLSAFPFSTLADNTGTFLCESCQIVYSPSLTVTAMIRNRQRVMYKQQQIVVIGGSSTLAMPSSTVGDGACSASVASHFVGTLPYTNREVDSIVAIFGADRVTLLMGERASKTELKRMDYSAVRYVHIATHGVTDEVNPLHSAILLASGGKEESCRLEPFDILQLQLASETVFLSACGTGAGQIHAGEGVVSLARPFLVAGAESVVATLWDIDDRSTSVFASNFYRRLRKDNSAVTSLAMAQRSILNSDVPLYRHPYYWAPFVLLGGRH